MNGLLTRLLAVTAICSAAASAQVSAQDWIVRFAPGDTLWDLCIKYSNKRGCWIELGKYNNIADDRVLRPGREIRFPLAWLANLPTVGKVESLQGEVLYDERSSGATIPLQAGQTLLLGSRILTREGTAKITLGQDSALLIRPHSELALDGMSSGQGPGQSRELVLEAGDVEVEVDPAAKSRFQITTPSAIAAVRGTRYRVSSRAGTAAATRSEVLAGAVEVQGVGATVVPAGFGLLARQGQALGKPRELLPPPAFSQARVDAPLPLKISWQADPAAVSWRLDLMRGATGGELVDSFTVNQPRFILENAAAGCYRLRLRAVDGEGFNGLESQLPVCIIARLPATGNIEITPGNAGSGNYQISWLPVAGAARYLLEVAGDADFVGVIDRQLVTSPAAQLSIGDAENFSVRVTAIDEYANSGVPSGTVAHRAPMDILPGVLAVLLLFAALI